MLRSFWRAVVRRLRLANLALRQKELDEWLDPKWGPLTPAHYETYRLLSEAVERERLRLLGKALQEFDKRWGHLRG